ncbi:MAG: diguanylate cyclase [Acidobacteria bacterium]|nr:diguanylate cyclase [Acidobacteriota bacterium]
MKVLVADDSLVMRRLLETSLGGWGYTVESVEDGGAAWERLNAADAPAIAVLDWMMPVYSGLELCRKVRSSRLAHYTYLILLTSKGLREDIVEGLGAGADDYVVKPFDKFELEVRLRAGRRIVELEEELVEVQEALRQQATHDALTGILNRTSILDQLAREVDRATREKSTLGVVMMDVDHFKKVNDTKGHLAGDAVLQEVVGRVASAVRSYDSFGRYGGEEFLVVVPRCPEQALVAQAERLRAAIEATPIDSTAGMVEVTASFGVTTLEPESGLGVEDLIKAADEALYRAKGLGRNRVEFEAAADHLAD